jgi:hypothetical protein
MMDPSPRTKAQSRPSDRKTYYGSETHRFTPPDVFVNDFVDGRSPGSRVMACTAFPVSQWRFPVLGSPLTVAGAATASVRFRISTVFPFDPRDWGTIVRHPW